MRLAKNATFLGRDTASQKPLNEFTSALDVHTYLKPTEAIENVVLSLENPSWMTPDMIYSRFNLKDHRCKELCASGDLVSVGGLSEEPDPQCSVRAVQSLVFFLLR